MESRVAMKFTLTYLGLLLTFGTLIAAVLVITAPSGAIQWLMTTITVALQLAAIVCFLCDTDRKTH
jgi:hypothetical protein